MQAFKCALRIIRGNLVFLLVYIVGLSFMGVFMAQGFSFGDVETTMEEDRPNFAVVDRDDSALSEGLERFLEQRGYSVSIDDSKMAFQDAVAKGQTDYVLIVPEGYEAGFRSAAIAGEEIPTMEVIYSFYAADGALVDEAVNAYLSCVRTLIVADPGSSMEAIASDALNAMDQRVDIQVIQTNGSISEADRFVFYLQWSTYTLFAGIVVSIGLLISTMNRADVRRRNLASPLSYASYNAQLALACAVIATAACLWTFFLGVISMPASVESISLEGLVMCFLSILSFSFMALAFGFMIGQFGASTILCNALGNIFGMAISFMGGAWISFDLLSPEVVAIAHWLPGYWYTDACQLASHITPGNTGAILVDIVVLLLFALAFLSVGFIAARKRLQTSEAGGNRSAEMAPAYS